MPKETLSLTEILFSGIFAICEITFCISCSPTVFLFLSEESLILAPASSITSIALSGKYLSLICLAESSAAAFKADCEYFSSWCSSNLDFKPSKIFTVSSMLGSSKSTFWNLLAKARSFSKTVLYSLKVVEPMNLMGLLPSIGLSKFEASITPPEVAPAPIIVWISSINNIALSIFERSFRITFSLFSKSPLYLVPASKEPISSEKICALDKVSGTFLSMIFFAKPSIRAVLPTPDSPTKIGLFLDLRARICVILTNSFSRPMIGSIRP